MGKWTTIVGAHVPTVAAPTDRVEVRYVLQPGREVQYRLSPTPRGRDRLLYENGLGPDKPDDKPEPEARVQ